MELLDREVQVLDHRDNWRAVSADSPCKICGKFDWCRESPDGNTSACHRETANADKITNYDNGQEVGIFIHNRHMAMSNQQLSSDGTADKIALASPEVLNEVYGRLLEFPQLALSPADRKSLLERGLTDDQIKSGSYRSFTQKSLDINFESQTLTARLKNVPGFRHDSGKWSFVSAQGLLIPIFNHLGQTIALKVRLHRATKNGKYVYVTSAKAGGVGPGSPVHFPVKPNCPGLLLRVTEGELKAALATHLSGVLTLSIAGVYGWRGAIEALEVINPTTVRVAFDMDAYSNSSVALQLDKFIRALKGLGYQVELELWDPEFGKGIDDVLASGMPEKLRILTGAEVDREVASICKIAGVLTTSASEPSRSGRLLDVLITNEEGIVADKVIERIKNDDSIYLRGSMLVRLVAVEAAADLTIVRRPSVPRIKEYPHAALRELITRYVNLQRVNDSGKVVETHVPQWLVPAIIARTNLPFRRLEAVTPVPVLLADGTILSKAGYDPGSGLFLACDVSAVVPVNPSRQDAIAASKILLELVADFPFEKREHCSAWLAFLLTLLARFAFTGPSPLFLIDANVRGSGKTLLAELVALLILGRSLARMTNPESDEECRKRITALVMQGEMLVLIDNVVGSFGCGPLDAALTGTIWSDRLLGKSETVEFPLNITWVASGNNIQVVADTSRRVCPIRLQSPEENPENRSHFKYPNITQHVLKAYSMAGRPDVGVRPWGSFEGWSRVVRDALVWCELEDPAKAREEFVQYADRESGTLKQLIAGWNEIDLDGTGMTVGEVISRLDEDRAKFMTLRSVLEELAPPKSGRLSSRSIGKHLSHFRGRNCGGSALDSRSDRSGAQRWRVIPVRAAGFEGFEGFNPPPSEVEEMDIHKSCANTPHIKGAVTNPSKSANSATTYETGEI
jgi:hypothetical protein